jgi:hypothetical protein
LIAGFAIGGTGSISVLARGVGPALTQFGVTGALGDPQLSLFSSTGTEIVSNSGWSSSLASVFAQVGAFLLSDGSSDAALVQSLPVGTYSAEVSSVSGGSGIALVELYDADTGSPTAHFVNLSARCQAGSGSQALIAGFIISGKSGETVLIRGVGPALGAFGVAGAMANPALNLFDSSGNVIASNVGWGSSSTRGNSTVQATVTAASASTFSSVGAFSLPANSPDCAFVATLPPGSYSANVSGLNNTTGVALVEVYELP